jgi:hypothetical protein
MAPVALVHPIALTALVDPIHLIASVAAADQMAPVDPMAPRNLVALVDADFEEAPVISTSVQLHHFCFFLSNFKKVFQGPKQSCTSIRSLLRLQSKKKLQ